MIKILVNIISVVLFGAIVALTPGVVRDALADQQAKSDLAEVNHIMYGIFSVNAWKGKLSQIVIEEIRKVDIKKTSGQLRSTIENQLSAVIDKLNEKIRSSNEGSLGGRIKQTLIDLVVDVNKIKEGVPGYADAVLAEINKPETDKLVKDMATARVKTYLNKTFVAQNMDPVNAVLERTNTKTVAEADKKLHDEIEARHDEKTTHSYLLIGLAFVLFIWVGIPRNRSAFGMGILFATLLVLLVLGIRLPMIDLEAKIADMHFSLIGHPIGFENQVLYFQSKSVFDVFMVMITNPDLKMKAVGVLLVLFSIVLPVLKLASSLLYYYLPKVRESRLIQFFSFKTGKWSMADVLVIAIMMAYIGFNGIVETQFDRMKALVPKEMTFITTNGTTLQTGYYFFFSYAFLALILTTFVKRAEKDAKAAVALPQATADTREGALLEPQLQS